MRQNVDKKSTQWHPLFAELLRPLLQDCYEVETDLPVGDLPRKADIVLVRKTGELPRPFTGLLRHLTTWNILEFKGRSVSARIRHVDLLVEAGLGIDRRLNEDRVHQKQRMLDPEQVSLWYLVNRLGSRFMRQARQRLGAIEEVGPGVWRSQILMRPLFLIDGMSVPVERESVPLHLVGEGAPAVDAALANVIVDEPGFWEMYGPTLGALHPNINEEAIRMAVARKKRKGDLDLSPFFQLESTKKWFASLAPSKIEELVKLVGVERIVASLSPADRRKLKEQLK